MRHGWIVGLIVAMALATALAGGLRISRRFSSIQASLTGPNLLPNNDFATDADADGLPDGWTTAGVGGVELSDFTFQPGGRSIQISGINNYLASPFIAVRPGSTYRVVFRALADNPDKPSPTRVRVRFHWRDAEGVEIRNEGSAWQDVPHRNWALITASAVVPPEAVQLSISIHPASDDRIVVDDLELGQLGVRVAPWPEGKQAALAFSFDYETAMGGLIHGHSVVDPETDTDALDRARRMRKGVDEILRLFAPAGIRGTWYANGYNFLSGNRERRQFMGNPTYAWANTANRWSTDYWTKTPWFALDPYGDERANPEWYFGSQIATLQAARQDIQSHTFAHFAGGLVAPKDWQADFEAWNEAAAAAGVPRATSLAFPWSWSAGMRWDSWEVLRTNGIRSVTRTEWNQPRFRIADRETYALRAVPGHEMITVVADELLTPGTLKRVLQGLAVARLNEGAIDVWAHTEEVTSPEQRAAWAQVIAASDPFWVAPVPEIAAWSRAIGRVSIWLQAEEPHYVFRVANGNKDALRGLTLVLPFAPARVAVDGRAAAAAGHRLILNVPGQSSVEVTLWPA